MNRQAIDELKRQISLLNYLQSHDWRAARQLTSGRWMGLCPLHSDHKPSFLLDDNKGLFYCYGCGRGGDVIRFVELYHQTTFPEALALLHSSYGVGSVVRAAAEFYRAQLHRCPEAMSYLEQRGIHSPEVIEHMRIGYAPGGCLRASLTEKGYPVWQAGFHHVTCSLGTHLNTRQFQQLCSNHRTMWLVFDADINGSGREAARRLAAQLKGTDITIRIVTLPDGHDPNSFFAQGGDADQFRGLLEASRP